jgi:hypothetical protein
MASGNDDDIAFRNAVVASYTNFGEMVEHDFEFLLNITRLSRFQCGNPLQNLNGTPLRLGGRGTDESPAPTNHGSKIR